MTELKMVQTIPATLKIFFPDEEKEGVGKVFDFKVRYKTYPQTPETKSKLEEMRVEKGESGFLEEVVEGVEGPSGVTFGKHEDGSDIDARYFLCHHLICQGEATNRFWEIVNKGVIEKNSKRSRAR